MSNFYRFALITFCLLLNLFSSSSNAIAQSFSFQDEPAISVFNQIQEETDYNFLYRESLVSDLEITLHTQADSLVSNLKKTLSQYNLYVKVDSAGSQLLILPLQNSSQAAQDIQISGQVVDAETGERLPYSTLSWTENGNWNGTASSKAGFFKVRPKIISEILTLEVSYVGYHKTTVNFDLSEDRHYQDVTIRLQPKSISGSEIIVFGRDYYVPQDSSLTGLIKTDRFSPLGEGNAVRALQILPATGINTAMNDGLNIRGSTPDGFHLELDEITIFNQSHLFGLLDSFNEDAVLNSGFFYDVAPAHINAPIGGKLSLTTRNGSLQNINAIGSISNTSAKATIEGPIKKGKSSWLVSGRSSYMNQLNWFDNDRLIRWGLDIDRKKSGLESAQNINANLVTPLDSDATYFDLHGKLYFETQKGNRNIASLYFGGDRTSHIADRLTRNNSLEERFRNVEVQTENRWNNFAFSTQHQRSLTSSIYSNTTVGLSAYETFFSKDDFLYTNTVRLGESMQTTVFTYPLTNRSTMNRGKIDQTFDVFTDRLNFKTGFTGIYHRGEYREESFDRQNYYSRISSIQADLFFQTDFSPLEFINIQSGLRTHYYSEGSYFKLSPRLKMLFFEGEKISFSGGYSKNYQFINRIGFSNAVTADVWILSNDQQPPSSASQFTSGIYLRPSPYFYFQVEGYMKEYENLRLHELNTRSLADTFASSPWFYQNDGTGKGVELLFKSQLGFLTIAQSYTLSSMKLQNESLNQGEEFFASWDRTHSYTSNVEAEILPYLRLFASFVMASGTVTDLDPQDGEETRLPAYYRLDVSALVSKKFKTTRISAKFSLFNVLDRQNPWYREYQPVIVTRNTIPAIRSEIVDVYDLGIQPSFEIKINF